ncbi:MAG: SDR family oxidoreductase [Chloroflexi bacterium]|nr:SDR family oxidoreductase [Chloroflexota bacterium]
MRLKDKVAIITGGGSGIGRASAILFAREGAKVAVASRTVSEGESVAAEIKSAGGEAIFIQTDVTKEDQVKSMVDQVAETFGGIDILFNCAGYHFVGEDLEADATPLDIWERTLAVNLTGTFLPCKYAIPYIAKRGGGSIINTSSISGIIGRPRHCAYAAAKGGVIAFTKALAIDYLDANIRANVIIPGRIDTPMLRKFLADATTVREPDCGEPDDVAYCALYLASGESKFTTGAEFPIDRGVAAR